MELEQILILTLISILVTFLSFLLGISVIMLLHIIERYILSGTRDKSVVYNSLLELAVLLFILGSITVLILTLMRYAI